MTKIGAARSRAKHVLSGLEGSAKGAKVKESFEV
jgi:hypothetical protein